MGEQLDPQAVIAAANLIRAAGYDVIPRGENERRNRAVENSYMMARGAEDSVSRLLWQLQAVNDQARDALAPSMPAWLRRSRSFVHNTVYREPLVYPPSRARGGTTDV